MKKQQIHISELINMTTTELLEFIDKEESSLLNEGESYYDVIHEDISVEEFCKKYNAKPLEQVYKEIMSKLNNRGQHVFVPFK